MTLLGIIVLILKFFLAIGIIIGGLYIACYVIGFIGMIFEWIGKGAKRLDEELNNPDNFKLK